MSELEPMTNDNIMPNVVGDTIAAAESAIESHATGNVQFSISGDGTTVSSTTPSAGSQITDTVTLVVYNPPADARK